MMLGAVERPSSPAAGASVYAGNRKAFRGVQRGPLVVVHRQHMAASIKPTRPKWSAQ